MEAVKTHVTIRSRTFAFTADKLLIDQLKVSSDVNVATIGYYVGLMLDDRIASVYIHVRSEMSIDSVKKANPLLEQVKDLQLIRSIRDELRKTDRFIGYAGQLISRGRVPAAVLGYASTTTATTIVGLSSSAIADGNSRDSSTKADDVISMETGLFLNSVTLKNDNTRKWCIDCSRVVPVNSIDNINWTCSNCNRVWPLIATTTSVTTTASSNEIKEPAIKRQRIDDSTSAIETISLLKESATQTDCYLCDGCIKRY